MIRDAKGGRDRVTMLPVSLVENLRRQLEKRRLLHEEDLAAGAGQVYLPHALAIKYKNAAREFDWQYLFASARLSRDPRAGEETIGDGNQGAASATAAPLGRHHVDESYLQRAVKAAIRAAGVNKGASCHTFRHSLRPICWRTGTISALSRNCLGTKM
jgi:integrase